MLERERLAVAVRALRKIVKFGCRRVPTKCEPDNRCEVCIAEAALAKLDEWPIR